MDFDEALDSTKSVGGAPLRVVAVLSELDDKTKAKVVALQDRLDQPTTASFGDFLKCLDFQRFFAAVTEMVDVIRDAMSGCAPIDETQDK